MLLLIIIVNQVALSEPIDKNMGIIGEKLKKAILTAPQQSAVFVGNIFWPDSETIRDHRISVRDIDEEVLRNSVYWWLFSFIRPSDLTNVDSLIFLTKMKNGDDWIINHIFNEGEYIQFIDGRILTVLIQRKINIFDTVNLKNKILMALKKNIHLSNPMELEINSTDSLQVNAFLRFRDENINTRKQRIFIWANGEFIVVNIPKIRMPYVDKLGLSVGRTIGGIALDNPRPFIRFYNKKNYNLKEELYKNYPWIEDSLKIWSKVDRGDGSPVLLELNNF